MVATISLFPSIRAQCPEGLWVVSRVSLNARVEEHWNQVHPFPSGEEVGFAPLSIAR